MALTKIADIPQQMLDIYSRKLLMERLPSLLFRQFVEYKLEFGLEPGEQIKFTILDNLEKGGKLADEDTPIPKRKMTGSDLYVTLDEFGNAASFSRRASKASLINLMDSAKKLLGRDYMLVMDEYLRDTFMLTANKYYANADFSGGATIAEVTEGFTDDVLDAIVEIAKNLNLPKLERGGDTFFAFIGTPRQIKQIRNSDKWLDARKYTDPRDMLYGEAGRLEDVIFLDSTQMNDIKTTDGSANVVSRGILIGADSVGYGESVPMELIPDPPEDFGRKQSIAWYTIAGAGILNDYLIEVDTLDEPSA